MEPISDLIGKRLNQHHLGESARAAAVVHRANLFLEKKFPEAENEVKAFRLKDGTLYIGTAGSVWSQEVWGVQQKLMEEIHQEYGQKAVLKIVIKSLTST